MGKRLVRCIKTTIENKDLKQTMGWDNKGKMHGANYNWHKDNIIVLKSDKYKIIFSGMQKVIFCRW